MKDISRLAYRFQDALDLSWDSGEFDKDISFL